MSVKFKNDCWSSPASLIRKRGPWKPGWNITSLLTQQTQAQYGLVSRASQPEKPWEPGCTNAASVTSSQIQGFYRFFLIKFSNFKTFHQERCVSLHHPKYLWFVRRTNEALTRQALNCCLVSPRNKQKQKIERNEMPQFRSQALYFLWPNYFKCEACSIILLCLQIT